MAENLHQCCSDGLICLELGARMSHLRNSQCDSCRLPTLNTCRLARAESGKVPSLLMCVPHRSKDVKCCSAPACKFKRFRLPAAICIGSRTLLRRTTLKAAVAPHPSAVQSLSLQ